MDAPVPASFQPHVAGSRGQRGGPDGAQRLVLAADAARPHVSAVWSRPACERLQGRQPFDDQIVETAHTLALQPGTGGFTDRSSWLVDMPTDLHLSGQLSAQRPCLSAIWPCGRRSRRGEIARDHGRRPLPAIQGLADASSTCPDDPRDQHEIVRLVHQEGHQAGLPEWQGPPRAWASLAECTTASSTCRSGRPHRSLDLQAPDDDQHVITFASHSTGSDAIRSSAA